MIFNMTDIDGYSLDEIATRSISGNIVVTSPNMQAGAFMSCANLTSITANDVTGTVGGYAFRNCINLTTASFAKAVSIGNYAFLNCYSLTTISFPLASIIATQAFYACSKLTTVSFPKVSSVASQAFRNCTSLSVVRFSSAIKVIGSYAFSNCLRLVSLYLTGVTAVPTLSAGAFTSTPIGGYSTTAGRYGSVYVPSSLLTSFQTATNWSSISSRIVAG